VAALFVFAFVFYVFTPGIVKFRPLSAPRWKAILKSSPTASNDKTVTILVSRTNFWGFSEYVEFPPNGGFNPSFLSLPTNGLSNGSFAVVAREEDPTLWEASPTVRPRWILGALLDLTDSEFEASARLRWPMSSDFTNECHSVERLGALIHSDEVFFPKCSEWAFPDVWFRNVQGPEDPRLFWSHLGEPLMIYNSISAEHSDLCRNIYFVDLRTVYAPVGDLLSTIAEPGPIRFPESVPLLYLDQIGFPKNWAPFTDTDGEVYFHTDLIPQIIFRLKLSSDSSPTFSTPADRLPALELAINSSSSENCITWVGNRPPNPDFRVHQSTPFLDVVFCTYTDVVSGSCNPNDPANRLYIGLIHIIHPDRFYERRIVTLNSTYPWNYVSISKPLIYSKFSTFLSPPSTFIHLEIWGNFNSVAALGQEQQIFTVSMNFRKRGQTIKSGGEYARGYLDDLLIISFGIGDRTSHFVEVGVEDVLRDHVICDDIANE
jgi:hypothetical protein